MGGLPGRRAATAQSLSCLRRGRSDVAAAIDKLPAEDCVQSAADPLCIPAACSDKTAAQIEYPGQNGGCTCVSCGLEVAWGLVPESDRTGRGGRPPTIILLTDGCVVAHPGRCLIPRPSPAPQRSETSLTRVPPSHRGQNANGLPKTAEDQAESMKNEGARFMVIGTGGRWKRRGPPPKAEGSPAQHWLGARPERRIGAVLFASQASATASVMKPLTPSPARPSTPALSVYPTGLSLRTLLSALAHAHGASAAERPREPTSNRARGCLLALLQVCALLRGQRCRRCGCKGSGSRGTCHCSDGIRSASFALWLCCRPARCYPECAGPHASGARGGEVDCFGVAFGPAEPPVWTAGGRAGRPDVHGSHLCVLH